MGLGIVLLVALVVVIGAGVLYISRSQDQEPASPVAALAEPTPISLASTEAAAKPTSVSASGLDTKLEAVDASPETDRQILTNLFHAANGEKWDETATWASERPLGGWYGVTTNDEGRVIELHLAIEFDPEDSPDDEILDEIHKLDELQSLYLFLRGLEERIPRELGNLSELRYLDITGHDTRGEIPLS